MTNELHLFASKMTRRQKWITLTFFILAPACNLLEPVFREALWEPIFSLSAQIKANQRNLPGTWLFLDLFGLLLLPAAIAYDTDSPTTRWSKAKARSKITQRSPTEILFIAYLFFVPIVLFLGWLGACGPEVSGSGRGGDLFRFIGTHQLGFYLLAPLFSLAYIWCANATLFFLALPVHIALSET